MHVTRVVLTSLVWFVLVGLVACGDNGGRTPKAISVTPHAPMIAAGETAELAATYQLSDGTTMTADDVTWTVDSAAIATVTPGAGGHATIRGIAVGTATITVAGQGAIGVVTVTVTPAVLRSIAIMPVMPSVAAGTSVQLTATGTYSDATTAVLSAMVTWSSSATATATVDATGSLKGLKVGTTTITAKLGAITGTVDATVTAALLTSIEVTPTNPSLALGTTQQLTATGVFSDATTQDLTAQVTWASNATGQVTVTAGGLATAIALGSAMITATRGTISGMTTVTATAARLASIAITPTTPSLARGRTLQLAATGTFTDATTQDLTAQVTWASGTTASATISATGLVQAANVGTSTITASLGAVTGSTVLTVTAAALESIAVTPTNPSVPRGRTRQFTAIGTFSDASTQDLTTQATWASSDTTIAQVSNAAGSQGLATALQVGNATISATVGTIPGTTVLAVTAAVLDTIVVTPITPSVAQGRTQPFTAIGTFSDLTTQDLTTQVTWGSDTPATATVSNAAGSQGLATTLLAGTATISATLGAISGSTLLTVTAAVLDTITVTPTTPSVARGRTRQFTAIGTFSDLTTQDLTTQVSWSSGTTTVATISNAAGSEGLASAVQIGSSTIRATLGAVSGSTLLTVTAAALESIQVTPVTPAVSAGTTRQFTATGTFSDTTTQDLTTQVTWASSDITVATISNAPGSEGRATTLIAGTTTISAAVGPISGSTVLTVTDAVLVSIQVTPTNPSLAIGHSLGFTATGVFSDATTQDLTTQVTWVSTDPTIAAISNAAGSQGLATGLAIGTTTIDATFGTVTGVTTLDVTAAVLDSIVVTPADTSLAKGLTRQFTAIGTFSDATTLDLTAQVTWAPSAIAVAQISNATGTEGLATGLGVGTTTISASLAGVTGSTTLTVTAALLVSIAVTPPDPSVASGRSQPFTATGTFTDATIQDLTTQVNWATGDSTIAQISNAAGSEGLAKTRLPGTTAVVATLNTVTGATTIIVTAAVLESITVTPATANVIPGGKQQYTATGHFSNVTTQNLTSTATWASGNTAVATVSNTGATRGQATGIAVGTTTITATSGTIVGSAAIVVLGPSVVATVPRDGTYSIRTSTPIIATFDQAIAPATLTTQTAAGACSGSLQLSADGFTTCVGFTSAAPAMSSGNTVATATPSPALQASTTYKIRVLGTVTNPAGGAGVAFTQPNGFLTATGGTCASGLVISQVYGAGGNGGNGASSFANDFIELHNGGAAPVDLAGYAVQYAAATGTSWLVTALPSVTLAAGGYFLVQESAGGGTAPALPTPDATGTISMSATAGKVALTPSTTALTGSCPISLTSDFVGYGATANCFEGTGSTGAPGNTTAVLRGSGGCTDANDNKTDFTAATPTPRNAATAPSVCACFAGLASGEANASFAEGDGVALSSSLP
jgi:uncharacterized protein YjdB